MEFLRKLLNPFGKNKNRYYQDLSKDSQRVSPNPPSELLLYSRDIAGIQIQANMAILNNCKWIRAEFTYPAFDSMNFIYKNQVFSVIIDIQDEEGKSYLPEHYIKRQLYASKEYNLIPCKFPVVVPDPHNPDISQVKSKNKGWNLFHTETDEPIIPEHLATTEKVEMSDWELRNFGIKFVMKYLQSQHLSIHSYQDTLEVDPQIWFDDKDGKKCWVVVRCERYPSTEAKKPKQMKEIIRRCFKNEGYFASIVVIPANDDKDDEKLYRMSNVRINFSGFEKIHSII